MSLLEGAKGKELSCQETEEMQVQTLGWENTLEEGTATRSSILAWRLSWTEEPGGLQSIGEQRVEHDWVAEPAEQWMWV